MLINRDRGRRKSLTRQNIVGESYSTLAEKEAAESTLGRLIYIYIYPSGNSEDIQREDS